ncbi:jg16645 [Pararge aegeria aegeria]|uniref:Jg16645 protein n=1 Tax=Pararge aegeria aegeria TaxID=348720 RepID=A0A8S4RBI7_9NEOP|nr:jg16645 [Pararge aegeria aegeria]
MGHLAWRTHGISSPKVLEYQPHTGKRSVGKFPIRWVEILKLVKESFCAVQDTRALKPLKQPMPAVDGNRLK